MLTSSQLVDITYHNDIFRSICQEVVGCFLENFQCVVRGELITGRSIMNCDKWSKNEKPIARAAFDKAYEKECNQTIGEPKREIA
jgi:hypothetical protein